MAKKDKKTKLTEAEKQHLESRFHQVRNHALCQWYEDAHGNDPQLKATAQARLQLQIWLREKRRDIIMLKQQRDACKADGDGDGADAMRKKLKHAQYASAMHVNMSKEGIPASTAAKARRKWSKKPYTLEEVLGDQDLDKRSEFGVNRDNMFDPILDEEDGGMLLTESLGDIQLEDKDSRTTLGDQEEGDDEREPMSGPTSIWEQHALHVLRRYRCVGLPESAVETKLAFQKKTFDLHVDRERQLREATESTPKFDADEQHPLREGVHISWNAVLVTETFSEHSLWELTCPMLWRHFEGGLDWDYPQWVPKGLMRTRPYQIRPICSSNLVQERSVRLESLSRRLSTTENWCFLPSVTRPEQVTTLKLHFLLEILLKFNFQWLRLFNWALDVKCLLLKLSN